MIFVDTHTHINYLKKISIKDCIKNAYENGVEKLIVPAASPGDIDIVYELANKYENVYGMLGIHPEDAINWDDNITEKIKEFSTSDKIVGIGEIGLDYYWDKKHIEEQKDIFIKQIKLANELNLPISVHDRDAHKDTFDLLREYNKSSDVVMHCFSGSVEFSKECIKEGFYIAIGGVVTFNSALKMKEVAKNVPLNKLLLETDTPYLTPVPHRGKENQPAYIKHIAETIANLRNTSVQEIANMTTQNAYKVFKIN